MEKITEIVIACNSASADYSNTEEVRGIVPFGVSSVLKSNGPQKILIAGNSIFRSGISRKLFGQKGLPVRERIAQPLSNQIVKGDLIGENLENDLQRILKPLKNYDFILLACTHYPAIENEIKKHLKPSSQLLDPVDEMVGWVQQIWPSKQDSVKRYLCPQEVRNSWNCSVITAKNCLMFTFQNCILLCKMKWTLPSKLKL